MTFSDFVKDEPAGAPYLHMNFDSQFKWDTKVRVELIPINNHQEVASKCSAILMQTLS